MSAVTQIVQKKDLDAANARGGSDRLVIAYFTATWCGPCRTISPLYEQWAKKYKQAVFTKCDIDQSRPLAAEFSITAVPTFVFFKNGRQLSEDTVKGANPKAVEAAIEKLAGKAQPNYIEAGTSPADKALQGHTTLLTQIDTSQTSCLNEAPDHSLREMLASEKSFLESDADEQLLANIAFLQAVKLFALRFTTTEGSLDNAPKTVRIFADQSDIGFDEASSQTPAQEFTLTKEQALGKDLVLLRYVKFQKTNSLQVFIVDNQGGEDVTRLDKLEVFGSVEGATAPLTGLRADDHEH